MLKKVLLIIIVAVVLSVFIQSVAGAISGNCDFATPICALTSTPGTISVWKNTGKIQAPTQFIPGSTLVNGDAVAYTVTLPQPLTIDGNFKIKISGNANGCIAFNNLIITVQGTAGPQDITLLGAVTPGHILCKGIYENDFPLGESFDLSFDEEKVLTKIQVTVWNSITIDAVGGTYPEPWQGGFSGEEFDLQWLTDPNADNDNDGKTIKDDCNDNDPAIYKNAPEACDGRQNNCGWDESMSFCECEGAIDAGCDDDGDNYCDSSRLVDLTWLETCSAPGAPPEIKFTQGCCNGTLEWYKKATGETDITNAYIKLDGVMDGDKKLYKTWDDGVIYYARGNDCSDGSSQVNPGAAERCYSNTDNQFDDDCDDGTNAEPAYIHWDNDGNTGINEGCEDDNSQDCERYGYEWIGIIEGAGSCCGNNTYAITATSGLGYQRETEFFPFWNPGMANFPGSYQYSGCWDSKPVPNDDTAAINHIFASLDSPIMTTAGQNYYFTVVSNVGSLFITEGPVNVTSGNIYTLRTNVSLTGDSETTAKIRYAEFDEQAGEWGDWIDTGIEFKAGDIWKIKQFNYTPSTNDILQMSMQVYVVGAGILELKDTKIITPDNRKILNINGTFRGCDMPSTPLILDQLDTFYGMLEQVPAILPQYYYRHDALPDNCSVVGNYYCSYAGHWKRNPDGIDSNTVKDIPETKTFLGDGVDGAYFEDFYMEQDCCPENYCWDGVNCQNGKKEFVGLHITNATVVLPDGATSSRDYKCVDGKWQNARLKPDQDNLTEGYCGFDQCFYNPPDGSESVCVNDGNFTLDDYCLKGKWSSRTNVIAAQFIDLVEGESTGRDYVLFCDSFENALNDYNYDDPFIGNVLEYLVGEDISGDPAAPSYDCGLGEFGCTNNFCVLKYKDNTNEEKVIFGTSLNLPINVSNADSRFRLSFLRLFGGKAIDIPSTEDHYTYCDGVIEQESDAFLGCDGPTSFKQGEDWDLWYNAKTQSIIYAPKSVNLGKYSIWDTFINFLKNPFSRTINFILSIPSDTRDDYSFIQGVGKFSRLYINKDGNTRKIKGFVERVGPETGMIVDYGMVGIDICRKVEDYNKKYFSDCKFGPAYCPLTCEPVINDDGTWGFHVESNDKDGILLWPDLTAKIRITGPVSSSLTDSSTLKDNIYTTG